jgi:PAS domain S-box-containing protein
MPYGRYRGLAISDPSWSARNEALLRAVFDSAQDAIMVMDADGFVIDFNGAAERMFGWTRQEAIGRLLADLIVPPAYREAHRKGLARYRGTGEGPVLGKTIELSALRRSGEEFPIELSIADVPTPSGTLFSAIVRDVTERKRLEVELRHAQKLESVGRLAAGIAHEINTPTQFVGDNIRFLEGACRTLQALVGQYRQLRAAIEGSSADAPLLAAIARAEEEADLDYLNEEVPKAITQALDGVRRVAKIVGAMKDFAHPQGSAKAPADLNHALQGTLTVARNELKYVADVDTDLGDIPPVVCHLDDLNQVFLNLLINAAHAIADVVGNAGQKGRIGVRTSCDGSHVLIAISDTGSGIPDAIRAKVFDPFFTTKEVGKGTGQGLALARSIVVEKHHGTLTFETEVGVGTTFYVRLPIDGAESQREAAA